MPLYRFPGFMAPQSIQAPAGALGSVDILDALPAASAGPRSIGVRVPILEQAALQLGTAFTRDTRRLSPQEILLVRKVFGGSIRCDDVRVARASVASAPTTLGNVIRIHHRTQLDACTFVHEMTHVWQYQTRGTGYISNSACAQVASMLRSGGRDGAYEIKPATLSRIGSFYDLSAEKQARTMEHYYLSTLLRSADRSVRDQARRTFWYLLHELTDPSIDAAAFASEAAQLDRMRAEVCRATPLTGTSAYEESMFGASGRGPVESFVHPTTVPLFRIEF
jgi:hypothetical protein